MECKVRIHLKKLLSLWTLVLDTLIITGLRFSSVGRTMADPLDTVKVSAVSGGEAMLPCDITTEGASDALALVVWYKDDVPIYSYDGRKGALAHWSEDFMEQRARWHPELPSGLYIRDVKSSDRATYRCRVDLKITPTRNIKVELNVIELPEKPKIFDERDQEVVGTAGPYHEGSSLKLSCVVNGGNPMPRLRWWRDDIIIAMMAPLEKKQLVSVLDLSISKLTREHLDAVFTCTADNTMLVPALRINIQIQLYLKPLLVEILPREQPLSVDQKAELTCRAVGARPPAVITWWLDGDQILDTKAQRNSADGNETFSVVRWTPRMEQNKRTLTCRAAHVILEYTAIETTMTLNLHYVPIVNLQLGSKMNPNDIEEGDDVYFDCIVHAHPPAYKVVWEHNGQVMTHNQRAGVIAGSAHLALQGVSRSQTGKYSCIASNVEGDGRSQSVHLQVIYKPVCKNKGIVMVGAAVNNVVKIVCEMDSYPPPEKIQWILNNSMGSMELEPSTYVTDNMGTSILTYKPISSADYGSLACRGINIAGQQAEPCWYTLLPAVKPDALSNCTTTNVTYDSIELQCSSGYDGGLRTTYVVEAWASGSLITNVSAPKPIWRLKALGSGWALKMVFYAHNARGRSDTQTLRTYTRSKLASHTDSSRWSTGWVVSMSLALSMATLLVCFSFLLRRRRHRSRMYQDPVPNVKNYKGPLHNSMDSPLQPDDRNPDVVPMGKEYHNEVAESQPAPPPYGAVVSPLVACSRSATSLHDIITVRTNNALTPNSEIQSICTLAEDRRSLTSGTITRRREIVTTRTPLLSANARESCV